MKNVDEFSYTLLGPGRGGRGGEEEKEGGGGKQAERGR